MCENSQNICYFGDVVPAEIKKMIFDYLSIPDLLNLCLVCKSFNEFIGQSHDFMTKIWIKFYTFNLKDLESLSLSERYYEKLKVNHVRNDDFIIYLINLHQQWRKILIYNSGFKQIRNYTTFIESVAASVEELEISDIEILNIMDSVPKMNFSNLKRIVFRNVPSSAIECFLGDKKKLENAFFDIAQNVEGKTPLDEIIHDFLKDTSSLNHLQLGPHYMKSFFDRPEIDMKFDFKLTKLYLRFPLIRDPSPDIEENVVKFLSHQPNIDWILFFELQSDEVLNTAWNNIPCLKHVTIIGLEDLVDDDMNLTIEPNENIEHLDLLSRRILLSQLRKCFVAAPKLKILHVQLLTKYILEFTIKNHPFIEELKYENIDEDEEEVFGAFDQLKASQTGNTKIVLKKASFWHDKENPFSIDPNFWHS